MYKEKTNDCFCKSLYITTGNGTCALPGGTSPEEFKSLRETNQANSNVSKQASSIIGAVMMLGWSEVLEPVILSCTMAKTFFLADSVIDSRLLNLAAAVESLLQNQLLEIPQKHYANASSDRAPGAIRPLTTFSNNYFDERFQFLANIFYIIFACLTIVVKNVLLWVLFRLPYLRKSYSLARHSSE